MHIVGGAAHGLADRALDSGAPAIKLDALSHGQRNDTGFAISVFDRPDPLRNDWLELERDAAGTLFQSYAWTASWIDHAAKAFAEIPLIVAGRDQTGRLAFVLPFAVARRQQANWLTWLGQEHAGYGFGLYRRDAMARIDGNMLRQIIDQARTASPDIHGVHLSKQPFEWDGLRNPFLHLPFQPLADELLAFQLAPDFTAFYETHVSSKKRGDLRRAIKALQKFGSVSMAISEPPAERQEIFRAFQLQKSEQLAAENMASPFSTAALDAFYKSLLGDAGPGHQMRLAAMRIDGDIIAVDFAVRFQDRMYGLNRSMANGELRRHSPGRLLNYYLIEQACREGCTVFDLGPGAASYKEEFGSTEIACFATILPLSAKSVPIAALLSISARGKSAIMGHLKSSPGLRNRARELRLSIRQVFHRLLKGRFRHRPQP